MLRAIRWLLNGLLILALAATIALHVRSYNHYDHLMGGAEGRYLRIDSQHGRIIFTNVPNYRINVPFRFLTTDVSLPPLTQTITITLPPGNFSGGAGSITMAATAQSV